MSPAVLWAAGGEANLVMPGHLSALPHTGRTIIWISALPHPDRAVLGMQIPLYRYTRGGFSSDWAGYQDHCNSEAYLPKHSGPALLQLLCLCHLGYWDESFVPLLLCQLQSLNPCLQSRYAPSPLPAPSLFVHRQQHHVKEHQCCRFQAHSLSPAVSQHLKKQSIWISLNPKENNYFQNGKIPLFLHFHLKWEFFSGLCISISSGYTAYKG